MPSDDELIVPEQLEQAALGSAVSIRVLGNCMSPLFRSGDVLLVARCAREEVAAGDLVVVRNGAGRFVAHLLLSRAPLRTVTLAGAADPEPVSVLGRVVGINDSTGVFGRPWVSRPLVLLAHAAMKRLRARPLPRSLRRVLRAALDSRWVARLRGVSELTIHVRRLNFEDLIPLLVFTSGHLSVPREFLKKQLWGRWHKTGAAVGAFDAKGRICGFAFLDEFRQEGLEIDGWWIRSLFVEGRARRAGVGRQLVRLLCQEARAQGVTTVRADIPHENRASRALFAAEGFARASPQWEEWIAREWERNGVSDRWVVMERAVVLGG